MTRREQTKQRAPEYAAALAAYREQSESAASRVPDFERVRGAVEERRRAKRAGHGLAKVIPLAAAAAIALYLLWPSSLPEAPEPPAAVTSKAPTAIVTPTQEPDRTLLTSAGVDQVTGVVGYEADGAWRPLDTNTSVEAGAAIDTGVSGRTTVSENRVASIDVAPRTRVRFHRWNKGSVALELERGRIQARVEPRNEGQSFEIRTPIARVTVVGTVFVTRHDPENGTVVEGIEGRVRVSRADGTVVGFVSAGEMLHIPVKDREDMPVELTAPATEVEHQVGMEAPALPKQTRPEKARAALAEPAELSLATMRDEKPKVTIEEPVVPIVSPMAYARELVASGDPGGAIEILEGEVESAGERDRGELVVDLASLLQRDGRGSEARQHFDRYLEQHPEGRTAATVHARLARLEKSAGHPKEALDHWRAVLALPSSGPHTAPALRHVGQALLASGEHGEARELFESFLSARGERTAETALVGLMTLCYTQGRIAQVLRLAGRHEARFPDGRRKKEVAALVERAQRILERR